MNEKAIKKAERPQGNIDGQPRTGLAVHDKLDVLKRAELEEAIESGQRTTWIRMWFKHQYKIELTNDDIKRYEQNFMGERAKTDKEIARKIRRRDLIIDVVAELKEQIENQKKRLKQALEFEEEMSAKGPLKIPMKVADSHMRLLTSLLGQYYRCMQDIGMQPSRELYLQMSRLEKREVTFDEGTEIIKIATQVLEKIPDRAIRDNFARELIERGNAIFFKAREGLERAAKRTEIEEAEFTVVKEGTTNAPSVKDSTNKGEHDDSGEKTDEPSDIQGETPGRESTSGDRE